MTNRAHAAAAQTTTMMVDVPTIPDREERDFWRDRYWDAVLDRDRRLDGVFYYAVLSTGVYCRPSCASRRPKRANVLFFQKREAAEHAGFRPCLRCRPETETAVDPQAALVEKVCRHIEDNLDNPVTLGGLGRAIGLSPFHLQRTFKSMMGITPRGYADACRLEALKAGLRQGGSVTRAMYDAGYGSSRGLYERAASQLGMTPARYRNRGQGEQIRYAIADSPIGRLLVAATAKGICSISIGDSDEALDGALRTEFERAAVTRRDADLAELVRGVLARMEGESERRLPLDIRATAFQRRVWEHLQTIPFGKTESYIEVARRIGQPKASRAVARACATNPVAIAIPCHRVVREDGGLGGYRWGLARKQKLLAIEAD